MINKANLYLMVEQGYISQQKHPTLNLYIYNYTQKCQFERIWNNETLQCRGLILDKYDNIVARPFGKFFNYEEHTDQNSILPPLPNEPFEVFDKLDGSLGILYWNGNKPCLATRGSFVSEQAIEGTRMLNEISGVEFDKNHTYLFEIIYPENRIVIDYSGKQEVVLLAVINTETGAEASHDLIQKIYGGRLSIVIKFSGITNITKIKELNRDNAGGFVILFRSGVRTKIKYDEYVRLHRLVTGVNAKTIWDLMRHEQSLSELIDRVPDEFHDWVIKTQESLQKQFDNLENRSDKVYQKVKKLSNRKDQALAIMATKGSSKLSGIVFQMLDGKNYKLGIWNQLKPKADKPWKEQI